MDKIITLLFLSIFPLGQIIRIGVLHPIDFIAGLGAVYAIHKNFSKPKIFSYFTNFLWLASCSFVILMFYFWDIRIFYGLLYLIRLCAYFYFFIFILNFAKKKNHRSLLLNSLLSISIVSSIFGWIQLFTFADLKPFFTYGWDEHLFRIVGTFLDPTFLGLIIVFGIIIAYFKKKWLILIFLLVTLIFTYSRASYLAMFGAFFYASLIKKISPKFLLLIPVFLTLVYLIPTTKNTSINLFRSFSAIARVENYKVTLEIFKKSPVFGIGYNNLCFAKNKYIAIESYKSHACSGSDSSLLLVLATTGLVGLMVFIQLIIKIWKNSSLMFKPILVSALIHSLFSNSLFYPWILGYLIILFATNLKE